jgi:hypothetical protein
MKVWMKRSARMRAASGAWLATASVFCLVCFASSSLSLFAFCFVVLTASPLAVFSNREESKTCRRLPASIDFFLVAKSDRHKSPPHTPARTSRTDRHNRTDERKCRDVTDVRRPPPGRPRLGWPIFNGPEGRGRRTHGRPDTRRERGHSRLAGVFAPPCRQSHHCTG